MRITMDVTDVSKVVGVTTALALTTNSLAIHVVYGNVEGSYS